MAVKVSVSRETEHREIAEQYAEWLQNWKNTGILPARFGRDGQWELNSRTTDSNIFKLHIRLPDEAGWKNINPN